MAFPPVETSTELGRPVFLYSFHLGDTTWAFASGNEDKFVGGVRYRSVQISDDGIKQSGNASSDVLNITAPSDIGPAQLYMATPPSSSVYVRIRHFHDGDTEAPLVYQGAVIQADFPEPGVITLSALPMAATLGREGLRLGWQRTCPYAVYDQATCKVNKADFATEATIMAEVGGLVVADEFGTLPNGYLNGGFMEWDHPVRGKEMRSIEEHIGETVRMFGLSDGLYPGLKVVVYPGCNLTRSSCEGTFDNWVNHGGIPHMPGTSPFDGDPVF